MLTGCGPKPETDDPVKYHDYDLSALGADEAGFIAANAMSGRDDMLVTVCGNGDRIVLVSLFDNLGKGASGAAIQNMNIAMGVDEATGLVVG